MFVIYIYIFSGTPFICFTCCALRRNPLNTSEFAICGSWLTEKNISTYEYIGTLYIIIIYNSNLGRGVQHYVINFVSDLRQVSGFKMVLRFPPP